MSWLACGNAALESPGFSAEVWDNLDSSANWWFRGILKETVAIYEWMGMYLSEGFRVNTHAYSSNTPMLNPTILHSVCPSNQYFKPLYLQLSVTMYIMNKVLNQSYPPGVGPWSGRVTSRCMFIFIKSLNSTGLNISLLNLMGKSQLF